MSQRARLGQRARPTSFTGRPVLRATAAQSSCSGATFTSSPFSQPRSTRSTAPPASDRDPVAVELGARTARAAPQRAGVAAAAHRPPPRRRRAAQRRHTMPGRPFFICAAVVHTSRAPAAVRGRRRVGDELARSSHRSPPAARRRLTHPGRGRPARRGRRSAPPPGPASRRRSRPARGVRAGNDPKREASAATSAAPVGVTSSALAALAAPGWVGLAQDLQRGRRRQRQVAGGGLGMKPRRPASASTSAASIEHQAPSSARTGAADLGDGVDSADPRRQLHAASGSVAWMCSSVTGERAECRWVRAAAVFAGRPRAVDQRADVRPCPRCTCSCGARTGHAASKMPRRLARVYAG